MTSSALIAWTVLTFADTGTQVPIYLELDGAFYSVAPDSTIEWDIDSWVVTDTSMTNCNRRNNGVQQYSQYALFYGPNLDIVYLSETVSPWTYGCYGTAPDTYCVLAMTSSTQDIVCGGAVMAPDRIFANGFESP